MPCCFPCTCASPHLPLAYITATPPPPPLSLTHIHTPVPPPSSLYPNYTVKPIQAILRSAERAERSKEGGGVEEGEQREEEEEKHETGKETGLVWREKQIGCEREIRGGGGGAANLVSSLSAHSTSAAPSTSSLLCRVSSFSCLIFNCSSLNPFIHSTYASVIFFFPPHTSRSLLDVYFIHMNIYSQTSHSLGFLNQAQCALVALVRTSSAAGRIDAHACDCVLPDLSFFFFSLPLPPPSSSS